MTTRFCTKWVCQQRVCFVQESPCTNCPMQDLLQPCWIHKDLKINICFFWWIFPTYQEELATQRCETWATLGLIQLLHRQQFELRETFGFLSATIGMLPGTKPDCFGLPCNVGHLLYQAFLSPVSFGLVPKARCDELWWLGKMWVHSWAPHSFQLDPRWPCNSGSANSSPNLRQGPWQQDMQTGNRKCGEVVARTNWHRERQRLDVSHRINLPGLLQHRASQTGTHLRLESSVWSSG